MKTNLFLMVLFLGISATVFSQKAILKGTVTDSETGETLPFSNIYLQGNTAVGTTSDLDGNYLLELNSGTYTVVYSFTSFKDKKETVTLSDGEVKILDMGLATQAEVLDAVEIVAERTKAKTVAAFDMEKMKSINMIDGTSAEMMAKTGDGDAGEVMKRVTGVSVEGGKHVYVRGLGDRYTKTILNGMEIPGLDPDRNNVQMDIFPTNLIDNIVVYKTFTPDLQGDFTGGMVDIQTKDFPTSKTITFSAGFGFNTQASFNKNFILYDGGSTDFLGFDDGTRKLPVNMHTKFPDPTKRDPQLTNLTNQFGQTMGVKKQNSFLNQSYSFGLGDQLNFEKFDYGYNFVINYRNSYSYFDNQHEDVERNLRYGTYLFQTDENSDALQADKLSTGMQGEQDIIWSALIGQSIKIGKKHKFSLTAFHTQNGKSTAAKLVTTSIENPSELHKQSLQYTQRSVTNLNLSGTHYGDNNLEVKWSIAPTLSSISDPDIRSTILELDEESGQLELNESVGSELRRIFRDLSETNISEKIDFTYTTKQWDSLDTKIKFGLLSTQKTRDYQILQYLFNVEGPVKQFPDNPDYFFRPENIWQADTRIGTYGRGAREPANTFSASQTIFSAYLMNELPINKKLSAIYGVRAEYVTNKYTGQDLTGELVLNNDIVLQELDFLPALNLVYKLIEQQSKNLNLRGSFSQTLARPSFREISTAQIYDPIQGRRYIGNLDLEETHIQNFDLRAEYYFGKTETIAVSGFYKLFDKPIEIAAYESAPSQITPINAGFADILGVELDFRKRINVPSWFNQDHKKLIAGANVTLVKSRVDMNEIFDPQTGKSQKQIREENAREGEFIGDYRAMYGQSPYILNVFVGFTNDSAAIDFNLSYNLQGKRLAVVGIGRVPDVLEQPFHSLNLKASKKWGATKQWKVSATIQNILGQTKRRLYENYGVDSEVFDAFYTGRTFSAKVSYIIK